MVSAYTKFQMSLAWQTAAVLTALVISLIFMGGTSHASRASGVGGGVEEGCPNGAIVGTLADGTTVHYCR